MVDVLTQADLLAVVDRALPDSYFAAIKEIGPGYEIWQGITKVGERCSQAVVNFDRDVYILTSQGGRLATVPVTFYRQNAGAGAGVMLAGTTVRASRGGRVFRTLTDAVFGPTDLVATTTGLAVGYGYEWNVKGPFTDRYGVVWPGEVDAIDMPLQNPVFWDPTILVRNDGPADGLGRPKTLDILGSERNLSRQKGGESDESYRVRIRTLPDTITPAAIRRQLTNYFRRMPGLFWNAIETWQHEYQECYDAPDAGPTPYENYDSTLFVYDDPRPPSPIRNRYLGENDYLGAFIVEVAMPPSIDDFGFAYDDPSANVVGVAPSVSSRALSAYDAPDTMAPPGRAPAYEGSDFGIESFFRDLYDLLDEIKAAGVFVVIHLQEL